MSREGVDTGRGSASTGRAITSVSVSPWQVGNSATWDILLENFRVDLLECFILLLGEYRQTQGPHK